MLLLRHMRTVTAARKQSTALFDDPDSQYFAQQDIVRALNAKLTANPDAALPEGFKRVPTTDVSFSYALSRALPVPESHRICYELVHDMLRGIGLHLIEPIASRSTLWKARPNAFGYLAAKLAGQHRDLSEVQLQKSQAQKSPLKPTVAPAKRKVIEIEPKREFTIGLKIGVSQYGYRDRALAEQVHD